MVFNSGGAELAGGVVVGGAKGYEILASIGEFLATGAEERIKHADPPITGSRHRRQAVCLWR